MENWSITKNVLQLMNDWETWQKHHTKKGGQFGTVHDITQLAEVEKNGHTMTWQNVEKFVVVIMTTLG